MKLKEKVGDTNSKSIRILGNNATTQGASPEYTIPHPIATNQANTRRSNDTKVTSVTISGMPIVDGSVAE